MITLKGTLTANTRYELTTEKYLKAGTYVLSTKELTNGSFYLYLKDDNTELASLNVKNNSSMIINLTNDTVLKKIGFFANGTNTNYDSTIYPMLELNSTDTEFVIHKEQTYPVTLPEGMEMCKIGDYSDEFVYQDNKWYKNEIIEKHIFDGSERGWYLSSQLDVEGYHRFFIAISNLYINNNAVLALSNYLKGIAHVNRQTDYKNTCHTGGGNFLVNTNVASTKEEWLSYLSENNLTAYVVLNEPVLKEITDTTLIQELNNIKQAYTFQEQTNITQTNEDLPFIIKADFKLSNLLRIEALEQANS